MTGDEPVAVAGQLLDLGPVDQPAGEIDTDPALWGDIGREEGRIALREKRLPVLSPTLSDTAGLAGSWTVRHVALYRGEILQADV